MNKRALIFVIVGIMLVTFCAAPPAQAIVPAVAWAIWGVATAVAGMAVVADETSDHRQAQANKQGQEESTEFRNTASELQ